MRRRNGIILTGVIAALVLAALGWRLMQRLQVPDVEPVRPLAVETLKLEPRAFETFIEATGTVTAERRAVLSAQLNASVLEVPHREGARVEQGETLVLLDEKEASREVDRQAAALERVRAELAYWEQEAQADAELFRKGMLERRRMDDSRRQVASLAAAVKEAQAALELARLRLGWTRVVAPYDGYVQSVDVLPGEQVRLGAPLVEMIAASPLKVVAPVAETDLPQLSEGLAAEIRIESVGRRFKTRIHRIYPALDSGSRNATVEMVLPMDDGGVRPGMAAKTCLFTQLSPSSLVVPRHAVHHRHEKTGIFVMDEGRARWREVALGASQGGHVELLSGAHAGDVVIVTPHPELSDGRQIIATGLAAAGSL